MEHTENFNGANYDVGTGAETSIDYIRQYINQNIQALWSEEPERRGDIRFSCADTAPLKELGWSAQIDIENGLKSCFGG